MAVKFTDDQQTAIKAAGTVLVSAAAGSGKTAVLTERVVSRICDKENGISADRLLIVTFTNASALEMRLRIAARLDERIAEEPSNGYYLKQKLLLQNAKICTIDSFCIDLVRKHFSMLGISPNFTVADPAKADSAADKALDSVLFDYYSEPTVGFDMLSSLFGVEQNENRLKDMIKSVYEMSMCMSDPEKWLSSAAEKYNCTSFAQSDFASILFEFADELLSAAGNVATLAIREVTGTDLEDRFVPWFASRSEMLDKMRLAVSSRDWDGLLALADGGNSDRIPTIKSDNPLKSTVTEMHKSIKENVAKIKEFVYKNEDEIKDSLQKVYPMVKTFCDIVSEFSKQYYNELSADGMLTFAQIEQLALGLLCDNVDGKTVPSQLSRDICREYDEVMVDEYQDNNDLQDALFFAVSDFGKHLFMVGDVKQSIYGFRGANPDNFLKHKNSYPLYDGSADKSKVILKANFRSSGDICGFVNAVCAPLMTKDSCNMDYDADERLAAKADFPFNSEPDVTLMLGETDGSKLKREAADAVAIAEKIEELMKKPPFLADKNGELRKAQYGDFAILMRSPSGRAKIYSDELKKRGIPVSYDAGGFFDSPEVMTAVSVLRVIDNPSRDIPLLAAMTSNVFAFTPDELADIRAAHRHGSLYSAVVAAAAAGNRKCSDMLALLSSYRSDAATLSAGRLLDKIYNDTALPEIVSAMPYGERRSANLHKLSLMADEMTKETGGGLSSFLSQLDRQSKNTVESGATSSRNAVRIMSLHGSKGLQFPICFLANFGGNFNKADLNAPFIYNYHFGIGASYIDDETGTKLGTAARDAMRIAERKKLLADEIRLLYVAMTRAEQRLLISVTDNNIASKIRSAAVSLGMSDGKNSEKIPLGAALSAQSYAKWLFMALLLQKSGDALAKFADVVPFGTGNDARFSLSVRYFTDTAEQADVQNNRLEPVLHDEVEVARYTEQFERRFGFKYPYDAECTVPSKIAVTELVHGDGNSFSFTARPEFMSKSGLTPAARGTAVHKYMQYADYAAASADPQAELERLEEWEFLTPEEAASIDLKGIKAFFAGDVYRRMTSALDVKREYKFMIDYPYKDSTTIIQGIADCIFFEKDGLVILDFKTDAVNDISQLKGYYSGQLEVYKYALGKIFGINVKECILYSMHLGKYISF